MPDSGAYIAESVGYGASISLADRGVGCCKHAAPLPTTKKGTQFFHLHTFLLKAPLSEVGAPNGKSWIRPCMSNLPQTETSRRFAMLNTKSLKDKNIPSVVETAIWYIETPDEMPHITVGPVQYGTHSHKLWPVTVCHVEAL